MKNETKTEYTSNEVVDPIKFAKLLWPDVQLYKQQKEIICSVAENVGEVGPINFMLLERLLKLEQVEIKSESEEELRELKEQNDER